jgi:hypothetical protein
MKPFARSQRGSALLVTMAISTVLLLLVIALFQFAGAERRRASSTSRELTRRDCTETGLLLARSYFAANSGKWNTYLNDPDNYDPVPASWNVGHIADPTAAALKTAHPELFFDLDGDGKSDVYIYVRDNQDELLPATNNWRKDNDQNVIIGALCISGTLVPRLQNGQLDSSQMTVESLLSYNQPSGSYGGQANGGASGNGNVN